MWRKLYQELEKKRSKWANEEEVRQGWVFALQRHLNIDFHAERGRKDSSYNNVIIEFKDRGLFRGQTNSPAFEEAIYDRLLKYILAESKKQGMDASDYIGIAIDGDHLAFAQVIGKQIEHGQLLPLNETSVAMVAQALRDQFRRAVSAENLIEDFGPASDCGSQLMQALADSLSAALEIKSNSKIRMLFEEWRTLFGQVSDLSNEQLKTIQFSFNLNASTPRLSIPASLFVVHTYNSLLIKLLAAEIVSTHGLTSYRGFSERTAQEEDSEFRRIFAEEIERGTLFSASGVKGFVEEAIFSWYLDAAGNPKHGKEIVGALREVLIKLSLYRTDKLTDARSRDVLKSFYEQLVPESLRKSLGEFYTPDWLVEYAVDQLGTVDWLHDRILDPTCGSGSFLLEVIRRKRQAAAKTKLSAHDLLRNLVEGVWGFDLNPLAVQTSRVNFLIAIADLLQQCRGATIELPVLLADAIYSPAPSPETGADVEYKIGSSVANLTIRLPATLASDRRRLDDVFESMGTSVEKTLSFSAATSALIREGRLTKLEVEQWRSPLEFTYNNVLALHKKNWNGIWFRIVRNFFWSGTAGRFDAVVGNPPWVRWSKLPDLYRERVKPTCLQYDIFSSTPHHGGNELDISAMITFTVSDKWLKTEGKMVFVLTQTHFQSPSSEGFRRFILDAKHFLVPIRVEDFKALKPFPEAANKTTVVLFKKSLAAPEYPVPYVLWNAAPTHRRLIDPHLPKIEVFARLRSEAMEGTPVSGPGSPWAILRPGRFAAMRALNGPGNNYQGRKGVTTDLNGLYFPRIVGRNELERTIQIETRPEAGDTPIGPQRRIWIEPEIVFPLIKGASDFSECYFNPTHNLFVLVPNEGITKPFYEEAEDRIAQLRKTSAYFAQFQTPLSKRSTLKGRMKKAPYYAIYNVGDYTFSPYKVIWAEQSGRFKAAVATSAEVPYMSRRPYVPDHKIFFVDFARPQPAYFLCGLLAAPLVREFVEGHNISIQVGDVFKHMSLPPFSSSNGKHVALARLVKKAHDEPNAAKRETHLSKIRPLAEEILTAGV